MNLAQVLETTFVLLEAEWPADQSRKLVRDLPEATATHVIVHQGEPGGGAERYFLYTRREAHNLLIMGGTVREAFDLDASAPAPVLDAAVALGDTPRRAVVFVDGRVAGFVDTDLLTLGAPGSEARSAAEFAAVDNGVAAEVQRSLVANLPESVPINGTASLLVFLTANPPPSGESLSLELTVGSTIDIVVQPGAGLAVEGRRDGSIPVTNDA